ncbi:hypothetical protein [Geodermatophilus sp. FMUSA9-8]|uniref:hypothetical protein n=1 Tax=Geodermatophilus sp. FMUSA9-8 TaxID=3120155 RepID=UPI00300B778C
MSNWPFAEPPDTAVFTTQSVLDGARIRDVHHDEDGDWQILCGTTLATEDARIVHLAHLVEMAPSLASLADLPRGWWAGRCDDVAHDGWHRRPVTLRARMRSLLRRR